MPRRSFHALRTTCLVSALCLAGTWAPFLTAHEGPEHEIEEITQDLERYGESAERLIERAIEFGVLGKTTEAVRDLRRALELDPGSVHALRQLAQVQFQAEQPAEALETASRALRLDIKEPANRAALLILRSECFRSQGDLRRALHDCEAALRLYPQNPEWYLLRSELQRRLGHHRRRIAGLQDGLSATGAGVLQIERVEALLDAGRFREALPTIEEELAASRLPHAWLLRRARARIGLRQPAAGESDARAARDGIQRLVVDARPDPTLLLELATANLLLGDETAARQNLARAGALGADPETLRRVEALFKPARSASTGG